MPATTPTERQAITPPDPTADGPIYLDHTRPIEERVNDLVGRMSRAEKISQMGSDAPAIERLGIPKYNWWNEALHGVANNGVATVFPEPVADWRIRSLCARIGSTACCWIGCRR